MKKQQIETLEKLKKQEELPETTKNEIKEIIFNNLTNTITIMLLLSILLIMPFFVGKEIAIAIYKITSMIVLLFSIFLFEYSYKKDDGNIAINGIEMLVLAIIILYAPYCFMRYKNVFIELSGIYFLIYYSVKTLIIYKNKKKQHNEEISDIPQIVKKESKDKIIEKKKIEEKKEEKRIRAKKQETVEKKTSKPKTKQKATNNKKTKKTSKKEEKIEAAPKKRGRPRKEQ